MPTTVQSIIFFFFKLPLCFEEPWFPLSHFKKWGLSICCESFKHRGDSLLIHEEAELSFKSHLHAGMYFPLVQHKGFVVQRGFCCCSWLWGFFLFLTKLSVVLSIWGCCLLPFSSSNSENLGYCLLSLFALKDFICFVGTHKSPVFPLFVLSIFFPQRRNRSSVKMFSGHLAALCT